MIKDSKQLIITGIVIIVIVAGVSAYLIKTKNNTSQGNLLSAQEVGQISIDFINKLDNVLQQGITASLVNIVDEGEIYKIRLKIGEIEYDSYVSKDGKYLFPEGYDLTLETNIQNETGDEKEISKREIPDAKLFIMSYCPSGLQAQKMFLPVYDLLKEKAQMGIYFVNYIMHEKHEIDENLRQYCIQEKEKEKYSNYLSCFIASPGMESCSSKFYQEFQGDRVKMANCVQSHIDECLQKSGINKSNISDCMTATDKEYNIYSQYEDKNTWLNGNFPKFDVHSDLNQKYGVRGSPTVVINDEIVQVNPRSPEKFKEIICQAFNSSPEECSQTLSDTAFSSGFGLEEGTSSGGECK
ncbi:MAG: DsbA family protein [Candidatus Nealsonbacteria bacterium]